MELRDPVVFGRNVKAFRSLRSWSIRDLSERTGISTKTIVKIEQGNGCTVRIERKIARGFDVYVGRLWDADLLTDQRQRVIREGDGRWFFAEIEDAAEFHRRQVKARPNIGEDRLRSDPDEIQLQVERHRLGYAGLSRAFVRSSGGGLASGYFQFNQCEIFARDFTPADGFNYTYMCICVHGGVRLAIRGAEYELEPGDSMVFEGNDVYWIEPLHPIALGEIPPTIRFFCLRLLALPKG